MVSLANLSDNFRKCFLTQKGQQKNLEKRSPICDHFSPFTAYSASLSQYAQKTLYREIDFENWKNKINAELSYYCDFAKQEIRKDDFAEK